MPKIHAQLARAGATSLMAFALLAQQPLHAGTPPLAGPAVIARVNGAPLTAAEFRVAQGAQGAAVMAPVDPRQPETRSDIEKFVNQELAAQQARAMGLDRGIDIAAKARAALAAAAGPGRNPATARARQLTEQRRILSWMFVDRLGQLVPPPTEAQVLAFYNENPALFGERNRPSNKETKVVVATEPSAFRQSLDARVDAQARAEIHMMLRHRAHGAALQAAMGRLRAAARIEIIGDAPMHRPLVLASIETRP